MNNKKWSFLNNRIEEFIHSDKSNAEIARILKEEFCLAVEIEALRCYVSKYKREFYSIPKVNKAENKRWN